MKKILLIILVLLLTGCTTPTAEDYTNKTVTGELLNTTFVGSRVAYTVTLSFPTDNVTTWASEYFQTINNTPLTKGLSYTIEFSKYNGEVGSAYWHIVSVKENK